MSEATQMYISEYSIAAHPLEIAPLRAHFIEFLLSLGLDDAEKEGWKLTFSELVYDAIKHGCQGDASKSVMVRWWSKDTSVWLEAQDPGQGPSAEQIANPSLPDDPLAEGGRGFFIINSFVDSFQHWTSLEGYIARIGKTYTRLNSVLPRNAEMDAILDELSDCYESLSLFDRMAENLIGDERIDTFTRSGFEIFMDAREYDGINLEIRHPETEPEYRWLAELESHRAFGQASARQWDLLETSEAFSWNCKHEENNFSGNEQFGVGCAVPIMIHSQVVGLIAVAYSREGRTIQSKDIGNLRALSDVIAVSLSRHLMERERDEKKKLAMEVSIATKLQHQLLPLEAKAPEIPGYELFSKSLSALEVAGDFVEVRQTESGEYLGCVIDVMGKGVTAAILAGIFRSQFIAFAYQGGALETFLERTNQALENQLGSATMFITAFIFKLKPQSNELSFAAAGHPPALFFRPGQPMRLLESSAPPLGLFPEMPYRSEVLRVEPGDRMVVVTDGLYEWTNVAGIFGWEAMVEWFEAHKTLPPETCWAQLHEKIACARKLQSIPQEDDETLLILNRK